MASPIKTGGPSGTLTVTVQKGSHQLWCGIPGHEDKETLTTIKVG
jgi:uncharacterized cupredoxin-like copper-binding protein